LDHPAWIRKWDSKIKDDVKILFYIFLAGVLSASVGATVKRIRKHVVIRVRASQCRSRRREWRQTSHKSFKPGFQRRSGCRRRGSPDWTLPDDHWSSVTPRKSESLHYIILWCTRGGRHGKSRKLINGPLCIAHYCNTFDKERFLTTKRTRGGLLFVLLSKKRRAVAAQTARSRCKVLHTVR